MTLEQDKAERQQKLNKMIDDIMAIGAKEERKKVVQLVKKYQEKYKDTHFKMIFEDFLKDYKGA